MTLGVIVECNNGSNYGDDLLFLSGIRLLNLYYRNIDVRYYVKYQRLIELAQEARLLIESIPPIEIITQLEQTSLNWEDYVVVHVGGTIFTDCFLLKSLISYYIKDNLTHKCSIHPDVYLSLGVARYPYRKGFVRKSLNAAKMIAVRDYSSYIAVSELVKRYDAFVIPDSVFSFPFQILLNEMANYHYSYEQLNIVRHWPYKTIIRNDRIYRTEENGCYNIGFCSSDKDIDNMIAVYDGSFNSMIKITKLLSSSKYIVSERYHGVVAAMTLGVPVLGHCIDSKLRNLALDCDAEKLCNKYYLFSPQCSSYREKVEEMYINYFELAGL